MDEGTALYYQLLGVMHSVDKWLEEDELKHDAVNRAAIMREKTLRIVETLQRENQLLRMREQAAVKCICDIETYLALGSAKYIKKTIDAWRSPNAAK